MKAERGVDWYIEENHPAAKAAILRENVRRGYRPVPGSSDHDMGSFMQPDGPTSGPIVGGRAFRGVYRVPDAGRPRMWPLWTILGVTIAVPLVAGLAVR